MAKKNRGTLKHFFRDGSLPAADQFGDLIDSTLNMIDEGFDRSAQNGFEISLIGDHSRLISFFKPGDPKNPIWTIEFDQQQDRLLIRNPRADEDDQVAMVFDANGKIGVSKVKPEHALDVAGVIAAEGRIGANPGGRKTVPADGSWHDITDPLTGCHALEVMAGVGSKGSGRYALMRAVAMNTFNPRGWIFNFLKLKNRIRYQQAYYLSRGNRIRLRWRSQDENRYTLQMRTACGHGDDIHIRYFLTRLWFDETMSESKQADNSEPGKDSVTD